MSSLKIPRLKLMGRIAGLRVYLVSGQYIRDHVELEFTCGGNFGAYPKFVPLHEVWIDDALFGMDRTATTLHEMVERDLMLRYGWSYDRAHEGANARERVLRRLLNARKRNLKAFSAKTVDFAYQVYLAEKSIPKYTSILEEALS